MRKKPGNEMAVLSETAKSGLAAIDNLVLERNSVMQENIGLKADVERLTSENEGLCIRCSELQMQRDAWMQHSAKVESLLGNLYTAMNNLNIELKKGKQNNEARQIAERFAPEPVAS
jgi:FtsZ-binding cell division protein ZapB